MIAKTEHKLKRLQELFLANQGVMSLKKYNIITLHKDSK